MHHVGSLESRPTKSMGGMCRMHKVNRLHIFGLIHSDRKSTRLNSSHLGISYAVFCLKKKKTRKKSENSGTPHVIPISNRTERQTICISPHTTDQCVPSLHTPTCTSSVSIRCTVSEP